MATKDEAARLRSVALRNAQSILLARRRAEEALRESEARFRNFADTAPAMLWVTEPDASCSFLSRGWYEFTGQTAATGLGFGWLDAIHPEDRGASRDEFLAASAKGEPFVLDHRVRRADGQYRWAIDAGRPRFDQAGKVLGHIGSVIDVHERKVAEQAVAEHGQRLDAIFRQTTAGFAQTDLTGRFTMVNDEYSRIVRRSRESLLDLRMQDITHPDDVAASVERFRNCVATGKDFVVEKRYVRPDGSFVHVRNHVSPVRDAEGRVHSLVAAVFDLSERKRFEGALKEADRRKNEFLAMLAHELRNPLAPIRNAVQVLRLAGGNGETVQWASEMLERQVGQMVRLVDDLLDISRISRGKIELKKERVELASVVHHAVEAARPLVACMDHELKVTLPPRPIYLSADPTRLVQVVENLLNNACKFTKHGGRISLTVEREGEQAVIRVGDNGIGIAADQIPRIFDVFAQVDTSLERAQGGLGIGLTLVKNLVEMHGGTMAVQSDGLEHGSEFVARLPIMVELPKPLPPEPTVREPRCMKPRRILVVDDNRDSATSLEMWLKLTGNTTHTVYDGLEAVDAAAKFQPDVVLLDIGLPTLNGYEAARRIREQPWSKGMVLVALTGWGQDEDRQQSKDAGFNAHMVKPVDLDALMELLASLPRERSAV